MGPNANLFNFYVSPGQFSEVLCSSANELRSIRIYSTNID